MTFTGLIAPPHTPFHADGSLNLDPVERQAEHFLRCGITGVFVAGSTGECQSLTLDERMRLAERWVDVARGTALKTIMQVGDNCLADARALTEHAGNCGADAIAAHAPCYWRPARLDDLIDFCAAIAESAPAVPFYFYDIPILTHVHFPMVDFLREGAAKIPTLAGLKYTNDDLVGLQQCVQLEDGRFNVLFGFDEILLAGLTLGADGAVGTTYNFAAPLYYRMIEALETGDVSAARRDQAKAVEMIAVLKEFDFAPAAKCVMKMIGIDCGPVRPPLRQFTDEQQTVLFTRLEKLDSFHDWYPRDQWQPAAASRAQSDATIR